MPVAVGISRIRHLAAALASVAAVSLVAAGTGVHPALAQPDTTAPTETAYAPAEEAPAEVPTYETPPAIEAPPTIEAPPAVEAPPVAPEVPQEPATQAPVVTEETQAPEIATTTAAPQVSAEPEPEPVTTTATAPIPTPTTQARTGVTTAATTPSASTSPSPSPGSPSATPTVTSEPAGLEPGTTTGTAQPGETSPAGESQTSPEETTPVGGTTDSSGATLTPSAELAAGVTETPEPQRLEASPQDIKIAEQAPPVQKIPPPAPPAEIDRLRNLVVPETDPGANSPASVAAEAGGPNAALRVLQWQPDWVQYDPYFRPLIFNPYPEPLQLVYEVGGVPRILLIPPLGRIVTEVRDLGSYNFTALRLNPFGIPIDVAVGNFFGGGYFPGPGLPPPPPPPPVRTLTDVPVQVKYTDATYRPIVVRKIVDVGPDPSVGGAHKVLLDGVTPAWGEWKQNDSGVPQFEVHQTQSFPGMEGPAEGPLPGDYDLQLVSDSSPTGLSAKDITLIVAAALVAALGLGGIFLTLFLGRRRRIRH
ncbi:hypothetical protein A5765_03980 [Mycolicibacterium celeriflavum]|uniref:hypothetical protein n=1 Tax=Mycolicibacterium celeriflavum TaxID=1249101 RepID=UPI0007FBCF4D|nr:hypothetical protein [Mycolicibacterium celeriflavum]OBG18548.1 hypothetical protein A5765_03980 [Mycolicibacterium celeriflavum]